MLCDVWLLGFPKKMDYSMHDTSVIVGSGERSLYVTICSLCGVVDPKLKTMSSRPQWRAHPSLKVPVVGRKDLDLHQLFLEITTHGGIEKVTKKRWLKEISRILNLHATATNISFVLRKYYYMLLYRFELEYYFGDDEANVRAVEEAPFDVPAFEFIEADNSAPVEAGSSRRRGKSPVQPIIEAPPQSMKGAPVVGVVDSEFSEGYYVTVTIGADKLKGVIMKKIGQPEPSVAIVTTGDSETMEARSHQRHDKAPKVRKVNPLVTRFKEGYSLYCKEQEAKLNRLKLLQSNELRNLIDDKWNSLPEDDKAIY